MDIPPWPDLIAEMGLLRRNVAESGVFDATVPHLAATEDQLRAAERRLGHPLDPQHRALLGNGNGWPEFYLDSALLSTDELGHGERWGDINENLDAFYEALPGPTEFVPPREEIYPITHDYSSASVFAVWLAGPITDGGYPVLWLPWQDSEPMDNVFEFFRMVYQEYEVELDEP